ncbi:MAG: hypothetical protein JO141_31400 [Bradyrhizobium sp.]|nr:hypothetical protein [Bradyrhizobium sp.]
MGMIDRCTALADNAASAKSDARNNQFIEKFQDRRDRRPRRAKISLAASGKSVALFRASRAHQEGRFAIVTDVGRGMRWTCECRKTSGACTDGEIVWS